MAPFIELMIALALSMLMFGAWGILVFMGGCGAYYLFLTIIGSVIREKPPG